MKRFLTIIIFFYILYLLQNSFFAHFSVFGIIPNFILISVIFFLLFESPEENFGFFVAGLGGFFIDIFSNYPFGATFIFMLALAFILKKISSFFQKTTILWFSLSSLLALILYNLFSESIFYLSLPPASKINLDKLLLIELIYNFILLFVGFYLA